MMQRWRCFSQRALFTVQHAAMSKSPRTGQSLIDVPPKQTTLRCAHCQGNIARHASNSTRSSNHHHRNSNAVRVSGPAAQAGTVCPQCGRHLPRCAICQLWLGTPDPRREKKVVHSHPVREEQQAHQTDGETRDGGEETGEAGEEGRLDEVMKKLLTFCTRCGHGYHAHHARMWFARRSVCAAAGCECLCQT